MTSRMRLVRNLLAGVLVLGIVAWLAVGELRAQTGGDQIENVHEIYKADLSPDTPLQDLLPVPPKGLLTPEPVVTEDLASVPELAFQELANSASLFGIWLARSARTAQKIDFLNKKKEDGFLKAMLENRPDLQGLPFLMGADCRMTGDKAQAFEQNLGALRTAMLKSRNILSLEKQGLSSGAALALSFWSSYRDAEGIVDMKDTKDAPRPKNKENLHISVRLGLLQHVLAPTSEPARLGLVKYVASISNVEATKALARLALFAPEKNVRSAAIEALAVRREKDYTDGLLEGFQYPWPEVARRAATALVELERKDLAQQLVDLLEAPDPRLPQAKKVADKETYIARQLVRVNHHQNCFLCHPSILPSDKFAGIALSAPIPQPDRVLPEVAYYSPSNAEVLVRVDVTYLRPDFSVVQPVLLAPKKWPKNQRFDFLVRNVALDKKQAEEFTTRLTQAGAPYREAVLSALRSLTGLDPGLTAPAWREALKLPG